MIALNVVAVPGFMRHDIPAPATARKFTYLYILPAEPLQMAEELPREKTDAAWLDSHHYHQGTTDLSGHADLLFDVTWIAGGWFADTNTKRDRVRGKEYLFRIEKEAAKETFKMRMKPGATVSGDRFSITVISIGKPQKKDASWYSDLRRPDD